MSSEGPEENYEGDPEWAVALMDDDENEIRIWEHISSRDAAIEFGDELAEQYEVEHVCECLLV